MGRSYTPKYAFILRETSGRLTSPMAWGMGPVNLKNARKYLLSWNKSVKPGGINAHLGRKAHATGIIIYNQKTKQDVLTYPAMTPDSFRPKPVHLKNPMDYCRECYKLQRLFAWARRHDAMKKFYKKFTEHRKAFHWVKVRGRKIRNPVVSRRKIKALKMATKLAYRIYKHYQTFGAAVPIPKRTPPLVKKYIRMILDANNIKWVEPNPPKHYMDRRYTQNAIKLLEFLNKYPNQWHTVATDARTKRALKLVSNILRRDLEVVRWTDKDYQIKFTKK